MTVKSFKKKVTPVINVITGILVVLFLCATGFFIFLIQAEKNTQEQVEPLVDSKVLMLSQTMGKLDILKDIYSVYDSDSFNKMKNSDLIGSNIKEMLFSGDGYNGNYSSKPTVVLSGSRFNPDASNLVSEYYTTVVVEYDNKKTSYNVIATFIDNVLIELREIP